MSSGYYYKGIALSDIYVNDGSTSNDYGFFNMPTMTSTKYSGMRPNSLGYTFSGVDLSNHATANHVLYTNATTTNVDIPTGVKSCRVISVGGSGGSGGAGGNASSKAYLSSTSKASFGGDGGVGGYGGYNYSKLNLNSVSKIHVVVGSAGKGGTSGNNNSTDTNSTDFSNNTKGGDGNSGNAGNSSYIYFDNNTTSHYAIANGGNGGGGGNGASAKAEFSKSDSDPGKSGSAGNSSESQAKDTNYPQLISYTFPGTTIFNPSKGKTEEIFPPINFYAGMPSSGADASNSEDTGSPGMNGAVQIIWLYD